MDVLIVGAGAMGRWFGRTLRASPDEFSLAVADADPAVAEVAADELDASAVSLSGEDTFEVVCLAVPMPAIEEATATQTPRAERALCDLAGAMAPAVAAAREHAPDRERLSLHPLFAPENAPGNVAAVPDAPGPATDRIRRALVAADNRVFETTPAVHDRAMETVQAKAHAAVLAFGLAAEDVPREFATPVYDRLADLLETVTGGDPRVYADVQAAFSGAGELAEAAGRIAEADSEEFEALYREVASGGTPDGGIQGGDPP